MHCAVKRNTQKMVIFLLLLIISGTKGAVFKMTLYGFIYYCSDLLLAIRFLTIDRSNRLRFILSLNRNTFEEERINQWRLFWSIFARNLFQETVGCKINNKWNTFSWKGKKKGNAKTFWSGLYYSSFSEWKNLLRAIGQVQFTGQKAKHLWRGTQGLQMEITIIDPLIPPKRKLLRAWSLSSRCSKKQ